MHVRHVRGICLPTILLRSCLRSRTFDNGLRRWTRNNLGTITWSIDYLWRPAVFLDHIWRSKRLLDRIWSSLHSDLALATGWGGTSNFR